MGAICILIACGMQWKCDTLPVMLYAWAGLVGDAIDLIPVVTGAGEVIRGLKTVGKISETVDSVTDVKKSVKGYLELAGDANNIQFLTRSEHLKAHGGNWINITHGRYLY